jgi:NADH dehydrogenase
VHRTKALAAEAIACAGIPTTTFASSLLYAPGDRRLARLDRLAWLPAVPLTGRGAARTQPLWAEDAAAGVVAALERRPERVDLAGPELLTHRDVVELMLRAAGRRRRLVPIPLAALRPVLKATETLAGPTTFATWDEALMLAVPMVSPRGSGDLEALGVEPRRMAEVLG